MEDALVAGLVLLTTMTAAAGLEATEISAVSLPPQKVIPATAAIDDRSGVRRTTGGGAGPEGR